MGKSGYSDAFRKEIDRNLEDHELIKIRLGSAEDQTEFKDYATMIADEASAHLVQTIGRIALLYRRRKEKPEIIIPRAV
jgi:RNA-binding protein